VSIARLLMPLAPPSCLACGAHAEGGRPLCAPCREGLRWLGASPVEISPGLPAWAPLAYDGPARAVVSALKFRGAVGLAAWMAATVAARAPGDLLAGATLVPVPLHPARRRRRGFNQAERLARALGSRTGRPVADVLRRGGPLGTQVGRGREGRADALSGAVSLRRGARAPAAAVLVDDVLTTGATATACAAALGGSGRGVLAFARALGR
jgi:predicted amidophosphoribosyltransferase